MTQKQHYLVQVPGLLCAYGGGFPNHPDGDHQSVAPERELEDTAEVTQLCRAKRQHLRARAATRENIPGTWHGSSLRDEEAAGPHTLWSRSMENVSGLERKEPRVVTTMQLKGGVRSFGGKMP